MDLTLFKLRSDLPKGAWGLRAVASQYREVKTKPVGSLVVRLWVRRSDGAAPRWQRDLMAIAAHDELSFLSNQSTGALLLIETADARFILAYGTGRHAISSASIEPGFGLRVVANSLGAKDIKSTETRSLGRRGRSQRIVMPASGTLHDLGIEPTEDLVRQLEGRPSQEFAGGIAGGDMLRLSIPGFSLLELPAKLDQIMDRYRDTRYKETFPFLDYFVRVSREDTERMERLNSALDALILDDADGVDFASPDIDEYLRTSRYVIRWRKHVSREMTWLEPAEVSALAREWGSKRPAFDLHVDAYGTDDDLAESSRRLLDYAVADVPLDDGRYSICEGMWYQVDTDHLARIQRRIDLIPDVTDRLDLPIWALSSDPTEGDYNIRAAHERGLLLLDRNMVPMERSHQKIEICDLLSADKLMLCVKKMTSSSTLSHLFAQGVVSASLLVTNADGYQDIVVRHLQQLVPDASYGQRSDWTVVYVIATNKPGPLSQSLFFFSKVVLDRSINALHNAGVSVALARVEIKK